jgi:glycosyltransferase involved in cell wall biosynthesis
LLARKHRVFYIDNFGGMRGIRPKDFPRIFNKLKRILKRQLGGSPNRDNSSPNPVVFQPFIIPAPYIDRVVGPLNLWLLRHSLENLISRYQITDPVIWTLVPSDLIWHSITGITRSALVYQSVDQTYANPIIASSVRRRLREYDPIFCQSADLVFACARGLHQEKLAINPKSYFFPNGVNVETFAPETPPHPALAGLPRPIIGFAGALGSWVDYDLIRQAAVIEPNWSFVILGPANPGIDLGPLKSLPNIHLLGAVSFEELPAFYVGFDCGLIPYRLDEFTHYTFPSKMAEYFAAGLPVISTALPELEPYSKVISTVHSAEELISAVKQHLDNPDQEHSRHTRIEVASTLSWESITSEMEALVDQASNRNTPASLEVSQSQ